MEIAGCLANLNIIGFDYFEYLIRYELVDHLEPLLSSPDTEDDLLLELVMWLGILCSDKTSFLIAKSTLVAHNKTWITCVAIFKVDDLVEMMETKKDDAEMLLQVTFTIEQLVYQEATRTALHDRTPVGTSSGYSL